MQTHTTDNAMPETKDEFFTILRHLHTSVRKTQIHLTAYSEEIATPEQIDEDDVPDIDFYNYAEDRETADEMLETSQRLLNHQECHRIHHYPGSPVFEDATSNTETTGLRLTRRTYNACEAAAWISAAHTISRAYTVALTEEAPILAEAQELARETLALLISIDEHGEEHTLEGGIDISATISATEYIQEMNPCYEEWAAEAEA